VRRHQCVTQGGIVAAAPLAPSHRGFARQGGESIVRLQRRTRLFGNDTARRDDEHVVDRQFDDTLAAHGTKRVARERVASSAENRCVILAAAERPDSPLALQAAKIETILDRAEIFGEIL